MRKQISLKKALKQPRFAPGSNDDLIETFAKVFHSFEDLHKVRPIEFLARLKKQGIVLKRKAKP